MGFTADDQADAAMVARRDVWNWLGQAANAALGNPVTVHRRCSRCLAKGLYFQVLWAGAAVAPPPSTAQ